MNVACGIALASDLTVHDRATVAEEFATEMEWLKDAKFGILIHWGIYGVNDDGDSWPIFSNRIPFEDYMKRSGSFTAERYDPNQWANLFKGAGARYAVLTTKHHDGTTLWDTQAGDLDVVGKTPAGRDLADLLLRRCVKTG